MRQLIAISQSDNVFCQSKIKNKTNPDKTFHKLGQHKGGRHLSSMKKKFCSHWVPNKAPEGNINAGTESLARHAAEHSKQE